MKTNSIRRFTVLGTVMAALLVMTFEVTAQTARTRPTVTTNQPASYRYAYQHGYRGRL